MRSVLFRVVSPLGSLVSAISDSNLIPNDDIFSGGREGELLGLAVRAEDGGAVTEATGLEVGFLDLGRDVFFAVGLFDTGALLIGSSEGSNSGLTDGSSEGIATASEGI